MDLDIVLRTSAVLVAASLLTRLLHRAAPAARHLVWHLAVVAVLVMPLAAPVAPRVPLWAGSTGSAGSAGSSGSTGSTSSTGSTGSAIAAPMVVNGVAVGNVFAQAAWSGTAVIGLWFALGWLVSGWHVLRSKDAPAEWVDDVRVVAERLGLRGGADVRQAIDEAGPRVAGLFHSVVLMPASATTWSRDDRRAALAHELAHIRRADRRTQALAQLACAINWFNPLAWHAARELSRERERACDAEAIRLGARPSAYATLLVDIARAAAPALPSAALSMARPSNIEGRLLSILSSRAPSTPPAARWAIACTMALVAVVALGASQAEPQKPEPVPASPPVGSRVASAADPIDASLTRTLEKALADDNAGVREQAAMGLALTPGDAVIAPLIKALSDPDAQVREKAAIGLAFRRDPRIVEPLLAAIEDRDSQVREKAAIALGASGDPRAVEALRKAASDPDAQVRQKAVAGLVLLGLRP